MPLKKTETTTPVVSKKPQTVKPDTKEEKPVKPAKKVFAKLPEVPVSEPKQHVAKMDVKVETKSIKKSSPATGGKFDPPAISLSKIRKAVSQATLGDASPVTEEVVKETKPEPVMTSTHLPEALVRKAPTPKKFEKPAAAAGKKTLEDLFSARNQAITTRTPNGFNPLDYIKR